MNSRIKSSMPDKISFYIFSFTIFLLPIFFIPFTQIGLGVVKGFILSLGISISLLMWVVARLFEGNIRIPKNKLFIGISLIPLVFLITAIFSPVFIKSFLGLAFDVGSFISILVLYFTFFLASDFFTDEHKFKYLLKGIFISLATVLTFQVIFFCLHLGTHFPKFFSSIFDQNIIGNLNDLGILSGILILSLISVMDFGFLKRKIFASILLALSLFVAIVVNFVILWVMLALFSLIIFIYSLYRRNGIHNEISKKKFPVASFTVLLICLFFTIGQSSFAGIPASKLGIASNDVRPSFISNINLVKNTLIKSPIMGSAPNRFEHSWSLFKDNAVNSTQFFNVPFNVGFGVIETFLVTTGLLGLICWLWFYFVYLKASFKSLIRKDVEHSAVDFIVIISSLFLILFLLLTFSSFVILSLTFVLLGAFMVTYYGDSLKYKEVSLLNKSKKSLFLIVILVIVMLLTAGSMYLFVARFTSVVYYEKGTLALNSPDGIEKALSYTSKAVALHPNDQYLKALSQVYGVRIQNIASSGNNPDEATKAEFSRDVTLGEKFARDAVAWDNTNYTNWVALGDYYASLMPFNIPNDFTNSLGAYQKALMLAPNNPSVYLSIANLQYKQKNYVEARNNAEKALNLKNDYAQAFFLESLIDYSQGKYSDALTKLNALKSYSPNDPDILHMISLVQSQNNIANTPPPPPTPDIKKGKVINKK